MEHFAASEISLQDKICFMKFKKNPRTLARVESLFDEENWNLGETRMMIESPDQLAAILKENRLEEIKDELKDDLTYFSNSSSMLTIRMPLKSFSEFGLIAEMATLLAKNGISIQVMSSPPDIHFIVSEDNAEKAYHTIKGLITASKKALEGTNKTGK